MSLEPGEKYLTIHLKAFGQVFKLNAFLNKEKTKNNHPDFKNQSDGVAVWISQKKGEQTKEVAVQKI